MKRLGINLKILAILIVYSGPMVVLTGLSLYDIWKVSHSLTMVGRTYSSQDEFAEKAAVDMKELDVLSRDLVLARTAEGRAKAVKQISAKSNNFLKAISDLNGISSEPTKRELVTAKEKFKSWFSSMGEIQALAGSKRSTEAADLIEKISGPLADEISGILEDSVKSTHSLIEEESDAGEQTFKLALMLLIGLGTSSSLFVFALTFFVMRNMSRSIDQVIYGLKDNAGQVNAAAHQIADASSQLSDSATQQATALEQTAASIEEMNSMVKKNTENAMRTSEVSGQSQQSAVRGKETIDQMISAMSEINTANGAIMNQISESNQQISEIVQVITEIGNKTKVINEIVFQTKLLSFNASVEAARAGEHGKGFAVVAEEVGNLAQMSGNAAKEITTMLDSSSQKVQKIVEGTKTKVESLVQMGKAKVEFGTQVAQDCGKVLGQIVDNVSQVTQMANSIASASHEQSQGIEEITKAMSQLDEMTQQNASAAVQSAASAQQLSSQSDSLRKVIEVLISTIKGDYFKGANDFDDSEMPPSQTSQPAAPRQNVTPISKARKNKTAAPSAPAKAVGEGPSGIPSEDDPRFKDV